MKALYIDVDYKFKQVVPRVGQAVLTFHIINQK